LYSINISKFVGNNNGTEKCQAIKKKVEIKKGIDRDLEKIQKQLEEKKAALSDNEMKIKNMQNELLHIISQKNEIIRNKKTKKEERLGDINTLEKELSQIVLSNREKHENALLAKEEKEALQREVLTIRNSIREVEAKV
jgi:hypothetical protein